MNSKQNFSDEAKTTFVVNTAIDKNDGDFNSGELSLREAIASANEKKGTDTITFNSSLSGQTFNLSLGELKIEDSLTINGLGAENIIIDSNKNSRVFNIDDGNSDTEIDVTIEGITITGGSSDSDEAAGGILNQENLTISKSTISKNSAISGGGITNQGTAKIEKSNIVDNFSPFGGSGILNDGEIIVISSNISNNSSFRGSGVGIANNGIARIDNTSINNNRISSLGSGAGISNEGTLSLTNSTVSRNNGGFGNGGVENRGTIEIFNSTITDNSGSMGTGGISNQGSATISSTIVAGNKNNEDLKGDGFISGDNNLIGNGNDIAGFTDKINGDIVGTNDNPIDPLLGELQDNGGVTSTIALLEGSPAIDAGSNPNNLETDQRGKGFNRTVGNGTDIGAFEVQNIDGEEDLVVSTIEDENDGDFSAGDLSLREAIALANKREGADTITFDSSFNGGTITFNEAEERILSIDDSLKIQGLGRENLTLDGAFQFDISLTNIDVELNDLNIVGGRIENSGNLTLTDSSIRETIERASVDNSSIISRGETLIINSTIRDNSGGGNVGVLIESGTTTIKGSTIANNDATAYAQAGLIIRDRARVNLSNSTVANNRGRTNAGIENGGTLIINNSTIANNRGGLGAGGIVNFGTATLTSSLLADNTGGLTLIGDVSGSREFISGGNNLISNGDEAESFVDGVNSDLVGSNGDDFENPQMELLIDARLGELQDNGGTTPTIALLEGSPAIDAGINPSNLETDQRGEGFSRTVGNGTDVGAFEVQAVDGNEGKNLIGSSKADTLIGGVGDDFLKGLAGNDSLVGNAGKDAIKGDKGKDTLSGGTGNDTLQGGNGKDLLYGGDGTDILLGNNGKDTLKGSSGDDTLIGGNGRDNLYGGNGDDLLIAGRGKDTLYGGKGIDSLVGGDGADVFVLEVNGKDTIEDFRDRTDFFGLSDKLSFGSLNIVNNDAGTAALIQDGSNNLTLSVIKGIDATNISEDDFVNI
ncbi:choice-of-anchor Q domain-containing protein [Myxosarcina sp. GI1]|uniref:choice-of-anchor Q domain-containing protein n=1 Tax=Myxosarcina sp. GI1 TaxID=1541065 RepID=UPI00055EF68F|nr:choice-of-anchor Q domain-containing protein [Myxosarcina sp. GI1]